MLSAPCLETWTLHAAHIPLTRVPSPRSAMRPSPMPHWGQSNLHDGEQHKISCTMLSSFGDFSIVMEKEMIFLIPHHPHSFVGKCWQSTMKVPDPYFSRCLCLHVNSTVPEAARLCPPRVSIVCCCSPPCTESTFPTPTFLLLILQIALPPGSLLSFSQLWDTIFLCAFKTLAILALKDTAQLLPACTSHETSMC